MPDSSKLPPNRPGPSARPSEHHTAGAAIPESNKAVTEAYQEEGPETPQVHKKKFSKQSPAYKSGMRGSESPR